MMYTDIHKILRRHFKNLLRYNYYKWTFNPLENQDVCLQRSSLTDTDGYKQITPVYIDITIGEH